MERFYDFEIHVKGVDYPAIISKKKNKKIDDIYDLAIANYIKNNHKKTEKDFLKALKKELKQNKNYKFRRLMFDAGWSTGFFDLEFDENI